MTNRKQMLKERLQREVTQFGGDSPMDRQRCADAAAVLLRTQEALFKSADNAVETGYLEMAERNLSAIKATKR